ncbi:anthrax toxin lethal factor-related metalloendopeptidase [Bacillus cereus]|nr:ADP-ribosyltransferase [Bacillus cereus]
MNQIYAGITNHDVNSGIPIIYSKMGGMNTSVPMMFNPDLLFKPDFKHDKEGAERWVKEHYKRWTDSLTLANEKVINELKNPADPKNYNINETLKQTGGDIYRLPDETNEEKMIIKKYENDLENIDRILRLKEGKTLNKMYVYKDMKLETFNETPESYFKDPSNSNKLNIEKIKELKEQFEYGISSDYLIGNLSERVGGNNGLLKWRIEIPAGTNSGHLDEDRLLFNMNTGLEIKDVKIINQQGREYIRIEAKLVPAGEIDAKIYKEELNLQASWNSKLNIDLSKRFFSLHLNDRYASSITKGVDHFIQTLWDQVPQEVIKKVIENMSEVGGRIIFTDTDLSYIKDVIYPDNQTTDNVDFFKDTKALYNPFNRTIIYNGISPTENEDAEGAKKKVVGMDVGTFIHEFGHAVDYYYGIEDRFKPPIAISETDTFKEIFQREGNSLTEYGGEDSGEFFAEAFRMMFSSDLKEREKVVTKAPNTVGFIKELLGINLYPNMFAN